MEMPSRYTLLKLSDTDLSVEEPSQDVRGRAVVDLAGDEIGEIDDLLIDDTEKKVRFLRVSGGGFLGMGGRKFLIPVDAITRIEARRVLIDRSREHVGAAPAYDPALSNEHYMDQVYAHYWYLPFWGAGYIYPTYPFYV